MQQHPILQYAKINEILHDAYMHINKSAERDLLYIFDIATRYTLNCLSLPKA